MAKVKLIADLNNATEAELVANILKTEEIPYNIKSNETTAYDGLFTLEHGWGSIEAPEEYETQILQILADFREGQFEEDGSE